MKILQNVSAPAASWKIVYSVFTPADFNMHHVYCPRRGLLCRWALNSMFVRCLSVCLSVSVSRSLSECPGPKTFFTTFSPLFRSVKSLRGSLKCVGFWLVFELFSPKVTQNPTHFRLPLSDLTDPKSDRFFIIVVQIEPKDLSDVGHVTQSPMVWIMLSTNLLRIWGGHPCPAGVI